MALLDSEIRRIRYELGYNVLSVGAEPYIGVAAVFEQVIQSNVLGSASTTSSTSISAAAAPTLATLTLASGTGFQAGDRAVVDVDDAQEFATIRSVSGAQISLFLTKAHPGTYPVTVEGGETIVREILKAIAAVKAEMATTFGYGALKRVDEIEFYQSGNGTLFGKLGSQLKAWRNELSAALGVQNLWEFRGGGGATVSVY